MARSIKMKANRKTFTGVLRVYINKFNIPDGEWFMTADFDKFKADEEENYRKEKGIEVIEDYREVDKYILEKYKDEAKRWKIVIVTLVIKIYIILGLQDIEQCTGIKKKIAR